jgi:hypothetical protein
MPLILLEGEEKSGKTWAAALLTRSEKIGRAWFLDLGEGSADDYINIPGARYRILHHDGTFAAIYERVLAVKAEAAKDRAEGKPPVLLVIDTMTDLWNGLKAWTDERHRNSKLGRRQYADDPDGEHKPSQNLWNDTNSRHRRLMTQLMTFPGVVVMTARGKEVTEIKNGKPVEGGSKVWSVTAQQDVPFDATLWVRMFRERPPVVAGGRSVVAPVRPGSPPQAISYDGDNLLEWLIFDVLRIDPRAAEVRNLQHASGGDLTEDERPAAPDDPGEDPRKVARQLRAPQAQPPAQRQSRPVPVQAEATPASPSPVQGLVVDAANEADPDVLRAMYRGAGTEGLDMAVTGMVPDHYAARATLIGDLTAGEPVTLRQWFVACSKHLTAHGKPLGLAADEDLAADPDGYVPAGDPSPHVMGDAA